MNSKWYWLIRQKCRNLKFQIKKAAFRLNERKESSERLSSFSRIVIRTLLVQVAINLVLVAVLYVGDKLLLSAMEILAKTQTDPLIVALPESILVDIVIGGIGVAGVILGLYCSNMTSVYSSKYTNAPATISSVFQRDVVTTLRPAAGTPGTAQRLHRGGVPRAGAGVGVQLHGSSKRGV